MISLRPNYESLQEAVQIRVNKAGGIRALSRQVNISPSYLHRLVTGDRVDPSQETLEKLGLERIIRYRDSE